MDLFKKIAQKIGALIIVLVISNFIYKAYFFQSDLEVHAPGYELVAEIPEQVNILYLGESSNDSYREDDIDHRKISDMLGDYFPDLITHGITKKASHAEVYYSLLKNIPKYMLIFRLYVFIL